MKMTELAKALAPDLPQKIIGIRPGEKLHEVMVPVDDGRSTVALEDRYVIQPAFTFWDNDYAAEMGRDLVPDEFYYASDNNDEWLDEAGLKILLAASSEKKAA